MWSTRTVTAFSTPQSLAYLSNAVSYAGMKWLHTKMRSDDPRIWAGAAPAFHGVTSCDAAAPAIPAPAAVRSPRRVRVRADCFTARFAIHTPPVRTLTVRPIACGNPGDSPGHAICQRLTMAYRIGFSELAAWLVGPGSPPPRGTPAPRRSPAGRRPHSAQWPRRRAWVTIAWV